MMRSTLIAIAATLCAAAQALAQAPDSGTPEQVALPDGAAKQTVETVCVACHDLRRVVRSNYSAEEWRNVELLKTRDEVDREVERHARQNREPVAALHIKYEKDGTLGRIANHIQTEKTLSFLFEQARKTA